MVVRIHDGAIVNDIALQIADRLGGEFDFTAPISNPKNIFLLDGGCAACIWCAPRIFEVHLLFPPDIRGRAAIDASKRMGDYMLKYHADMLWAQPSESDKATIWLARQVGFSEYGRASNDIIGPVVHLVRRKEPK